MTRRLLSDAQLDEIAILREQGKSTGFLAGHVRRRFGIEVSSSWISWQMLRIGADLPPHRRQPPSIGPSIVRRGNHVVRRFTPDEDRCLMQLEHEGLSNTEIGRRIGRKANSVRGRLMTLARHQARAEESVG